MNWSSGVGGGPQGSSSSGLTPSSFESSAARDAMVGDEWMISVEMGSSTMEGKMVTSVEKTTSLLGSGGSI